MNGSHAFFIARKQSEAERLLNIIANGNGAKRAFCVKQMEGSRPAFAICYNGDLNVVAGKLGEFAGFLRGYLKCEAIQRREAKAVTTARANHRRGK